MGQSSFKTKEEYNAYQREYRRKNSEKVKKYKADWRKKKGHDYLRYKTMYPEKVRAHKLVELAVKRGFLIHSDTCCKRKKKIRTVAHHDDYTKPLDVIWVCATCHGFIHTIPT